MQAVRIWPELESLIFDKLAIGEILKSSRDGQFFLRYLDGFLTPFSKIIGKAE